MYKYVLRKIIPRVLYEPIRKKVVLSSLKRNILDKRKKRGFCIIFISTPQHGNLGDQAIVLAQEKFFESLGLNDCIVEVPASHYQRYCKEISGFVEELDIIVIDGGGNMGTLWIEVEYKMRDIVKRFQRNPIFVFPQTIYYSDDSFGREELENSKEIYNDHKKLYICAREKKSYDFMLKHYQEANIILVPDIVLFLIDMFDNEQNKRDGAVLCLREDKEKITDNGKIIEIKNYLKKRGLSVTRESTVIPGVVNSKNRLLKLNNKWTAFAKSKIVITDRLHGMIFAFITNTPCLALDNTSGKVGNVYKWIANSSKLYYVSPQVNTDVIISKIDELLINSTNSEDFVNIKDKYSDLSNALIKNLPANINENYVR